MVAIVLDSHDNHLSHNFTYTYAKTQADSNTGTTPLFRYERLTSWLLISVFRHEERDTILKSLSSTFYTNKTPKSLVGPHKRAAHPVVFKISVGRDLQNSKVRFQLLNTMVLTQLQLSTWPKSTFQLNWSPFGNQLAWSPVNYQFDWPTVETQLTSFSKSPNSQPIASGHDVIHTPASFPIWGLSWRLWLSYPLRASVNCTQCLCTWTKSRIVQSPTTEW